MTLSTPYQSIPVTCSRCNHRFVAPVKSIIDVGLDPVDKRRLLSGRLNVAACPQCGSAGMLATPLVYHDPDKQLFLVFLPPELHLPESEQQRIIGSLTQEVMSTLPAEGRKGYLLNPRTFFSLDRLMTAILEADGITEDMLEAQHAKMQLLEQLLRTDVRDEREALVRAQDEQLDYEFFQLLTANIEYAESNGRDEVVQDLTDLREQLLAWSSVGREVTARQEAIEALGDTITREALLDKLIEAAHSQDDIKIETMVAIARPAIDYVFYQQLTERIDQATSSGQLDEANTLRALRERILELAEALDEGVRRAAEEATTHLQQILKADDLPAAVMQHLADIPDLGLFLNVLAANINAAEEAGQTEALERLRRVSELITAAIEEASPPEIRLVNKLLAADYPDGTRALLHEQASRVDDQLLELMNLMRESLAQSGRSELAEKLDQIRAQAQTMLTVQVR
jgi:hypothetical protein